jgi:outer membrane protein assembly factor BamB
VATIEVVGLALIAMLWWSLVWLFFLSRLRGRAKLGTLVAGLVVIVLANVAFEFRGVSGDVMPVFGWRWTSDRVPVVQPEPSGRAGSALSSPHDYPQFLGSRRDGSIEGVRLARDWSDPPRAVWRQPVGPAWSGFAIAGDFAVTQEQRGTEELVTCYDLATGELLWAHADRTRWEDAIGGAGPRATPAIRDGRVYALGATGRLNALDLRTGEPVWSRDVVEDAGASPPTYGVSASPLLVGDTLVIAAGGPAGNALVGYDTATGERRWSGGDAGPAYGSPRHATLAGVPQILVLNDSAVAAHDPTSGLVLWEFEWPQGENTFQPLVLPGDRVLVSTGYGVGARLLQVRADERGRVTADLLWESLGLKAKFTNIVYHEGFLYGLDDGILVCLDPADGQRRWKSGRHGHGQTLLVDDLLLVLGEDGSVALVEARPDRHSQLGRFAALSGKTWNHPALAGPFLVVRNDREAACFELPLAEQNR